LDTKAVKAADNAGDRLSIHMDNYFAKGIEVDEPQTLADDLAF
jgi:hypothetical protein